MGNVNFLHKTCSTHGKLLRNQSLHCWGSNHRVRNSPGKILGFSASVALVGFGVQQALRNNRINGGGGVNFENRRKNFLVDLDREGIRPLMLHHRFISWGQTSTDLIENLKITYEKKCKNGWPFSYLDSIKSCSLLTPVSCSAGEGVDVICTCSSCVIEKSCSSPPPPSGIQASPKPPVQNSECDCEECKKERVSVESQKIISSNQDQDKSSFPTSTSPSCQVIPNANTTTTSTSNNASPKVSNKPCRRSGSRSSCAQASDIDIEALAAQLGGLQQIDFAVGDSDLSHCFLMKQASQVTVDAVTRLLTEVASAYDDYHAEYRRVIDLMMDTLEESRKACGAELEVVECKLVLIRAKVDEMKRRISDVDMLLGSLEKLGTASAETAFMANAEYASVAMSERLHSLILEVKRLREESREKERDMLELQALIIVESGKSLK